MKYKNILQGAFIERPNRFIAKVLVNGAEETVHVKNTGRCRELLVKGCTVYLAEADNPARKTRFDLVAVEKVRENGEIVLINMDSQLPNTAVYEWISRSGIFSADAEIRREVTHGDSRFDLFVRDSGRQTFIEVKGVTLESNGVAMFPDAPTERGAKHLRGLADAVAEGYEAYVVFVIQLNEVHAFEPNGTTDPHFADELSKAVSRGVNVIAVNCRVTPDSIEIDSPVATPYPSVFALDDKLG